MEARHISPFLQLTGGLSINIKSPPKNEQPIKMLDDSHQSSDLHQPIKCPPLTEESTSNNLIRFRRYNVLDATNNFFLYGDVQLQT
ncbi:hypothetical protein F8M41_018834 [Gigaspora margarita]|uniref:Uncharacterized protein n=1 Tax=Gigaspora margarita TaxID=4874 RepID=A0A8H4AL18_GIGMA|nr:hypothetical protein F8M41_018834 [Gigaspora margarita]